SAYDPRRHAERARQRRDVVLGVLAEAGVIAPTQVAELRARPLKLRRGAGLRRHDYPAFMALVRRQLQRDYSAADLNAAGLNIFTTMDVDVQHAAEVAVRKTMKTIGRPAQRSTLQSALILLEPASGEILAMVGDRNPDYAGFNRATDARRPVGSVIKPFIYALAL